ncbi:MAG: NAD-dependent epimerase/dehydratase family protein [Bacteroidetes bacterium]|nr:NAD-dependent epimerase/dehydratase family protein [Bacteroidota bacterium]
MQQILIAGTNGMMGKLILDSCLQRPDVAKVTSITRKPLGFSHPKLQEIIHNDFLDLAAIEAYFNGQDICFYCLGVYTGAVAREAFRTITIAYTRVFAETLKRQSPNATFCFLSGQGADRTGKSKLMFAHDKGMAEGILESSDFGRLFIFRPGYIYPVSPRVEPIFFYRISRILYKPVLSKLYPNIGLTSIQLANAMIKAGFEGGDKIIYENKNIKQLLAE